MVVGSELVLDEVTRNIERKRTAHLPLSRVFVAGTPLEIAKTPSAEEIRAVEHCINAKDAPILAAAIGSGADCVVSGNTRHFNQEAARCAGIAIYTPAAYLAVLERSNGIRR